MLKMPKISSNGILNGLLITFNLGGALISNKLDAANRLKMKEELKAEILKELSSQVNK